MNIIKKFKDRFSTKLLTQNEIFLLINENNIDLIIKELKKIGFKQNLIQPLKIDYNFHRSKYNQTTFFINQLHQIVEHAKSKNKLEIIEKLISNFELDSFIKYKLMLSDNIEIVKIALPYTDISDNNFIILDTLENINTFEYIENFIGLEAMEKIIIEKIFEIPVILLEKINLDNYDLKKILDKLEKNDADMFYNSNRIEKMEIIQNKLQKEKIINELSDELVIKKNSNKRKL